VYQPNVIGIVSENYGDFTSTGNNIKDTDNPMPVALNGRVPVKISESSEAIYPGDYITTSTEPGKATKATSAGTVIGKALEFWAPGSGKNTVMVYIEQGYYDGSSLAQKTFNGLTFFNADAQFVSNVKFGAQVEFAVPPMFNSDTAGFAVIHAGSNKVDVVFEKPYIATPIVNTSMSFEDTDNITEANVAQLFAEDIKFVVINKNKNGFTIILNKNANQDIRFSWTALQVKDVKTFESVIPGLVIETPVGGNAQNQDITPNTENNNDQTSTEQVPTGSLEGQGQEDDTIISNQNSTENTQ
ncbi:MAG: hypothetical protein ACR2IQ_02825, partial [Minisyncoccia bacterium]